MPPLQINYISGQGVDRSEFDYTDRLPVNFIPTPRETGGEGMARYYMRSWFGIEKHHDTAGTSRGRIYNDLDKCIYQVCGTKLQKVTESSIKTIATISGSGRVRMAYSDNSTVIVAEGRAYYWNGSELTTLKNWSAGEKYTDSPATNYNISNITDVTHNGKRYCFTQKNKSGFFITDLQNEQRPDELAAVYAAEDETDYAIGLSEWRNLVVVMGTQTIQYFTLTGVAERVYAPSSNYSVGGGITSTDGYTAYAGSFAVVGRQSGGKIDQPPTVYTVAGGSGTPISSGFINKKLRQEKDLSKVILENVLFDSYNMLILRLEKETFFYESSTKTWNKLKDGVDVDSNYRGVDHVFNSSMNAWTVGDAKGSVCGLLSMTTATRYGDVIEGFLWSQNLKFDNPARLTEYKIDTINGYESKVKRMSLAIIQDGQNYGNQNWYEYSKPLDFRMQPVVRNFGRVEGQMTIAHRFIIDLPLCISNGRLGVYG